MDTFFFIISILVGFLIVFVLWAVSAYNRLISLKAMLNEAWSGVDVQLKRRYDLVPNLVQTVKGYEVHEKTVFENVTKMRAASASATGVQERAEAEAGLTQALKTLFAVSENYPDLKANQNFLELQKELSNIEHEMQLSRRYYNGTARNYNILVLSFPTNAIAKLSGFKTAPYFEVATSEEREAPKVKF